MLDQSFPLKLEEFLLYVDFPPLTGHWLDEVLLSESLRLPWRGMTSDSLPQDLYKVSDAGP